MSMARVSRAQQCPDCGAMMLGGPVTEQGEMVFHGTQASVTPWTCRHGAAWNLRDCMNRPVPPICCRHPPCILTPPPL